MDEVSIMTTQTCVHLFCFARAKHARKKVVLRCDQNMLFTLRPLGRFAFDKSTPRRLRCARQACPTQRLHSERTCLRFFCRCACVSCYTSLERAGRELLVATLIFEKDDPERSYDRITENRCAQAEKRVKIRTGGE